MQAGNIAETEHDLLTLSTGGDLDATAILRAHGRLAGSGSTIHCTIRVGPPRLRTIRFEGPFPGGQRHRIDRAVWEEMAKVHGGPRRGKDLVLTVLEGHA